MIVAGTGFYTMQGFYPNDEMPILRHANFTTISAKDCKKIMKDGLHMDEVICVDIANNQTAYDGDSGILPVHF